MFVLFDETSRIKVNGHLIIPRETQRRKITYFVPLQKLKGALKPWV